MRPGLPAGRRVGGSGACRCDSSAAARGLDKLPSFLRGPRSFVSLSFAPRARLPCYGGPSARLRWQQSVAGVGARRCISPCGLSRPGQTALIS